MTDFLDKKVFEALNHIFFRTTFFATDKRYKDKHYPFIEAVIERVITCVDYLNEHSVAPTSKEDLIVFLMFANMLIDLVKESFKQLEVPYPYCEKHKTLSLEATPQFYEHFKDICLSSDLKITEDNCPSDDKFFEYIRSLSFAHPVETSRPKFLQKNEIHYSPSVLKYNCKLPYKNPETVGMVIYSSRCSDVIFLLLPFGNIKNYIQSRYILLNDITKNIKELIDNQQ